MITIYIANTANKPLSSPCCVTHYFVCIMGYNKKIFMKGKHFNHTGINFKFSLYSEHSKYVNVIQAVQVMITECVMSLTDYLQQIDYVIL